MWLDSTGPSRTRRPVLLRWLAAAACPGHWAQGRGRKQLLPLPFSTFLGRCLEPIPEARIQTQPGKWMADALLAPALGVQRLRRRMGFQGHLPVPSH